MVLQVSNKPSTQRERLSARSSSNGLSMFLMEVSLLEAVTLTLVVMMGCVLLVGKCQM